MTLYNLFIIYMIAMSTLKVIALQFFAPNFFHFPLHLTTIYVLHIPKITLQQEHLQDVIEGWLEQLYKDRMY